MGPTPTYSDMGCKLALEDKEGATFFHGRRQRHEHVHASHAKPCNRSRSQDHKTKENLIEFFCSSCLLCVCCPLACVCCFIKIPCRICHQALRCAWQWARYGSKNRVCEDYSSFSDIDSDVASCKVKPSGVSEDRRGRFHKKHNLKAREENESFSMSLCCKA